MNGLGTTHLGEEGLQAFIDEAIIRASTGLV